MTSSAPDSGPLRMSAFEEYMLRDDRPELPMTMPTTLVFRGSCDFEALRKSFEETVASEPFFRSVVRKRFGRWYWIPEAVTATLLDASEEESFEDLGSGVEPIPAFDLRREPGVCCEYRKTASGFALRFPVHHAICDGLGTVRFLGNWFARYARRVGDDEGIEVSPTDPAALARREDFQIELPYPISTWTVLRSALREASHWLLRRPCRLRPLSQEFREREAGPGGSESEKVPPARTALYWKTFPDEYFERFRFAARHYGVSVNTLFLGVHFQVLARWLRWNDPAERALKKWVRVLMPTSLRKPCHDALPATNMLGYAFFDRRIEECHDIETLFSGLQAHVDLVKQWSMGAMFLSGVEVCRRLPGGLTLATSRRFCHSTSVFSNIGNPCKAFLQERFRKEETIRVGDAEFVRLIGGPPVRANTPCSVGLMLQGRSWTISTAADLGSLTPGDVAFFQKEWQDRMEAVLDRAAGKLR